MPASRFLLGALVAISQLAAANAILEMPLQMAVTAAQRTANYLSHGQQAVLPSRDVDRICSDVKYPPGFPRVKQAFNISRKVFRGSAMPFSPKPNYVQQTLNFSHVLPLSKEVLQYSLSQGVPLQNRGESHITVISPPEYYSLQPYISIQQLNELANATIQDAKFCIVCLGRDTLNLPQNVPAANQTLNTVYNIVVRSPDIVAYREKVQDLFIKAGGDSSRFDASNVFAPHITLGYTAANATMALFAPTDLFLENDIFKFEQSCVAPLTLI